MSHESATPIDFRDRFNFYSRFLPLFRQNKTTMIRPVSVIAPLSADVLQFRKMKGEEELGRLFKGSKQEGDPTGYKWVYAFGQVAGRSGGLHAEYAINDQGNVSVLSADKAVKLEWDVRDLPNLSGSRSDITLPVEVLGQRQYYYFYLSRTGMIDHPVKQHLAQKQLGMQ